MCPVGYCGSLHDYQNFTKDANITIFRDTMNEPDLNYGITNFDNIFSAFLTIFQCITLEGWTNVMYIYMDVANQAFVIIYFVLCVIINSFFLLNLTIAVMLTEYAEIEEENDKSPLKKQLLFEGKEANIPKPLTMFIIQQNNITIGKKATAILAKQ